MVKPVYPCEMGCKKSTAARLSAFFVCFMKVVRINEAPSFCMILNVDSPSKGKMFRPARNRGIHNEAVFESEKLCCVGVVGLITRGLFANGLS